VCRLGFISWGLWNIFGSDFISFSYGIPFPDLLFLVYRLGIFLRAYCGTSWFRHRLGLLLLRTFSLIPNSSSCLRRSLSPPFSFFTPLLLSLSSNLSYLLHHQLCITTRWRLTCVFYNESRYIKFNSCLHYPTDLTPSINFITSSTYILTHFPISFLVHSSNFAANSMSLA